MKKHARSLSFISLATASISWATGYAADPVSAEKIAVAQAALQRAEQSGAPQSAPVELELARSKFAKAQKAQLDYKLKDAANWADQANVDAQVAEASARAQQSHAAAVEFDASMVTLRAEAMRKSPTTTGQ